MKKHYFRSTMQDVNQQISINIDETRSIFLNIVQALKFQRKKKKEKMNRKMGTKKLLINFAKS